MFSIPMYIAILVLIIWYSIYKWKRRRLEQLMGQFDGPSTLSITNLLVLDRHPIELTSYLQKLTQQYESPIRLWLFNKPYLVLHDPEDFQTVAYKVLQKDDIYNIYKDPLGEGIFTAEVNKWRKNRKIVNIAFKPNVVTEIFLEIFNRQNYQLIQNLRKEAGTGNHFDLWPYIEADVADTSCETTFGRAENFPDQTLQKLRNAAFKVSELMNKRLYKPWLLNSVSFNIYKYFKGYWDAHEIVREYPLRILNMKKQKFCEEKSDEAKKRSARDIMSILLNFHEKQVFTDEELKDEVLTIMFAANETTPLTICFSLLMLAMRPDIQENVYEEIHEIFDDNDRPPTAQDLEKMTFLEQCIKETLRRFPIVPFVTRLATEDIPISGNRIIPSGASIMLAIFGIHWNPKYYPDPLTWNPHNFDPNKVATRHKCSFVPFSAGPRGCIGQKYAWISMKAQLSTILRNYKLSTDATMNDIKLTVDMVLRNSTGFKVTLEYRHSEKIF